MKSALASVLLILVLPRPSFPQDIKVRQEAVQQLERANLVSSSPKLPNLERIDTFRVFGDAGVQDGSFSRTVIQGVGRREEFVLGAFHVTNVRTEKQVAASGTPGMLPSDLLIVLRITPIWRVRFDGEDVIHSITDRDLGGHQARCIEFDTVKGQRADHNEICTDDGTGVLVRQKLASELIEYSDFFSFAGALFPSKISYSDGARRIEITQSMTTLESSEANVLTAPGDAQIHKKCSTYRRPFGLSMPQPKAGSSGSDADIVVGATIGTSGQVLETMIRGSERADLNEEALALAKQWTFTPALCDGHPEEQEVDFTLHFQSR